MPSIQTGARYDLEVAIRAYCASAALLMGILRFIAYGRNCVVQPNSLYGAYCTIFLSYSMGVIRYAANMPCIRQIGVMKLKSLAVMCASCLVWSCALLPCMGMLHFTHMGILHFLFVWACARYALCFCMGILHVKPCVAIKRSTNWSGRSLQRCHLRCPPPNLNRYQMTTFI
ncbi:hypothetical protein AVEN_116673-1 [Araneus ventricosus]|uniref:Uncharacterized protein n=1 Tax=Araneus ventricosus TaxID=182803 RepID=A0A4Y2LX72_ARAVE|nr:hypothetical protein AVEN_116673-1 [Araneus ventricosus]